MAGKENERPGGGAGINDGRAEEANPRKFRSESDQVSELAEEEEEASGVNRRADDLDPPDWPVEATRWIGAGGPEPKGASFDDPEVEKRPGVHFHHQHGHRKHSVR